MFANVASPEPLLTPEHGSGGQNCLGAEGKDPEAMALAVELPKQNDQAEGRSSPVLGLGPQTLARTRPAQTREERMVRQEATPNIYGEGDCPDGLSAAAAGFVPKEPEAQHTYSAIDAPRRFVRSDAAPTEVAPQTTHGTPPTLTFTRETSPGVVSNSYLPMNGSKPSYEPMTQSRGALPSPPASTGTDSYDLHFPEGSCAVDSDGKRGTIVYSEIPGDDAEYDMDNIYATVDELR